MKDLPAPVAEAGLLFRQPSITSDAEAMRRIITWGHQQIDVAYPEDPIRAPLNIVRRKFAHMQWDRVIWSQGRELRGVVATQIVQDLAFEIKLRQDRIMAEEAERRRQDATTFDSHTRVREHGAMTDINQRVTEAQMRLAHQLRQEEEDAASRRRIEESNKELERQLALVTIEAVVKSMGATSAEKTIEATRLVNDEISRIRTNPDLTEDDKHFQIKTMLEALPQVIRSIRPQDV